MCSIDTETSVSLRQKDLPSWLTVSVDMGIETCHLALSLRDRQGRMPSK